MTNNRIEIYRASGIPELQSLRLYFEAAGVPIHVQGEHLQGVVGELPMGWATAPQILVDTQYLEIAQRLLNDYLKKKQTRSQQASTGDDDTCMACGKPMLEWESCPACGWSYDDSLDTSADESRPLFEDSPPSASARPDEVALSTPTVPCQTPSDAILPIPISQSVECLELELSASERTKLKWDIAVVLAIGVLPQLPTSISLFLDRGSRNASFASDEIMLLYTSLFITIAMIGYLIRTGRDLHDFGIDAPQWYDLFLGVGLATFAFAGWPVIAQFLPIKYDTPSSNLTQPEGASDYSLMVLVSLSNAAAEEIVTRGCLITMFLRLWNSKTIAVLFAACCFASYHIYQGFYGVQFAFVFGVCWGVLFLKLHRLWPLVLGHCIYNILVYLS